MSENLQRILELIHDPKFIDFKEEQNSPSIFNAVGRTHTETWHSALIGWLLDPYSSHKLNNFPLKRLLILLKSADLLSVEQRGIDINELLVNGDFSNSRVRPNEKELSEVSVADMKFDIFIDGIKLNEFSEIQLLIEVKVKSNINKEQCNKYINYVNAKKYDNIFTIPIFIAPASLLDKSPDVLFGSDAWIPLDFQQIYDEVIEHCLLHPLISEFGKFTMKEYTKTLKYRLKGAEPLTVTNREKELVRNLFDAHESGIRALYEILSQERDDFQQLLTPDRIANSTIKIKINNTIMEASSIKKLYLQTIKYLFDNNKLNNLELPIPSGPKRYLLARQPKDQNGDDFLNPVSYEGYFMEANKSRAQGLRDLVLLLGKCGLNMEVIP